MSGEWGSLPDIVLLKTNCFQTLVQKKAAFLTFNFLAGAVYKAMNRQEKARSLYEDEIQHTLGMGFRGGSGGYSTVVSHISVMWQI